MPLEYQRYGRNKETLINNTYISGGEYRHKFDKITDNTIVSRTLYSKAKEMLQHRSGTMFEDMYWIDGNTGTVIASALNEQLEGKIRYSDSLKKLLQGKTDLIAMHTHPQSMPPSIADFNSAFKNKYDTNIVLCHDGTVYMYVSRQEIEESLYIKYISRFLLESYSEKAAQLKALKRLKENHDIDFWEVK